MSHDLAREIERLKALERKIQQHHSLIKDALQDKRRSLNALLGTSSTKPEETVREPIEDIFGEVVLTLTSVGHFINPYPKASFFVNPDKYSTYSPAQIVALLHSIETGESLPFIPAHLTDLTDQARRRAIILEQNVYDDARFKSHFYRNQ